MPESRPAIELINISKRFPDRPGIVGRIRGLKPDPVTALDSVSLRVDQGEVYGLVGPNGSGKTTLIKVCATLHLPDEGSGSIAGIPLEDTDGVRARIGLLTDQERSFFWRLTCGANLRYFGRLFDLGRERLGKRIDELSGLLELGELLERRYDRCSAGMKQRVALARALLTEPEVLLLDEPTRSLDPLQAFSLAQILRRIAHDKGIAVIASSHRLDIINECADRTGLLFEGHLVEMDRTLTREPGDAVTRDVYEETIRAVETGAGISPGARARAGESETGGEGGPGGESGTGVEPVPLDGGRSDTMSEPAPPERGRHRPAWLKAIDLLMVEAQTWLSYRFSLAFGLVGVLLVMAGFALVSRLVGEGAPGELSRYNTDYFTFVVVGIAFAGLQGVALNSLAGLIRKHQQLGTLEFLMLSATPFYRILLASTLLSLLWILLLMSGYVILGQLLFGADLSMINLGASLLVTGVAVAAVLGFGLLSAGAVLVLKRADAMLFSLHGVMLFFGGVFFPVELLPGILRAVSSVLPITWALSAMRKTMIAGEGLPAVGSELLVLALFALIGLLLGVMVFRLSERKARLEGTLLEF